MYASAGPQIYQTRAAYLCPNCQQFPLLPRFHGDLMVACARCQNVFNLLYPPQPAATTLSPQVSCMPQQGITGMNQALSEGKMIAQNLSISLQHQQQEVFQAEMRHVADLLHQQQQAILARVECVERLQVALQANIFGDASAMNYNPFPGTVSYQKERQSIKQEEDQNEAEQPQERRRASINARFAGAHSAEIQKVGAENQKERQTLSSQHSGDTSKGSCVILTEAEEEDDDDYEEAQRKQFERLIWSLPEILRIGRSLSSVPGTRV